MRSVTSPEELLAPFKAHYETTEDMQRFLDNPGRRAVFIMTFDSKAARPNDPSEVHFNCGLETLASTLLVKRPLLTGVDFMEVVKVDLGLVRDWLTGGQIRLDRQTRASLERLALDLDHPDQLFYYKNGRTWLYRGTTLVSEGAFYELIQFKDRADRMNLHRMNSLAAVNTFLDFTRVPRHPDYFPLSEAEQGFMDAHYASIPLKTRVLCPVPSDKPAAEKIKVRAEQVYSGSEN